MIIYKSLPVISYLLNKLITPGEYKGKVIRRQDYVKIKESGYAWEVSDPEGFVSYIDGAGHRASNWLKFVNCCRG